MNQADAENALALSLSRSLSSFLKSKVPASRFFGGFGAENVDGVGIKNRMVYVHLQVTGVLRKPADFFHMGVSKKERERERVRERDSHPDVAFQRKAGFFNHRLTLLLACPQR